MLAKNTNLHRIVRSMHDNRIKLDITYVFNISTEWFRKVIVNDTKVFTLLRIVRRINHPYGCNKVKYN